MNLMNLKSALAAAIAMAGLGKADLPRQRGGGQRGCQNLGARHPEDGNGQHRNERRAAHRRRVKAWGGIRQFKKQRRTLRVLAAQLRGQP